MKRKIWSLMLCLVLVCTGFAGCGSKDDGTAGVAPEQMVQVKLQEFVDSVSEMLEVAEGNAAPTQNVGYDMTVDIALGKQITQEAGLTGLESVGMDLDLDIGEKAQVRIAGNLLLNAQDVIGAVMVAAEDALYMNLPEFSGNYMKIPYEQILGMSLEDFTSQLATANEGMPTLKDMLAMWKTFSSKFIDTFEYQGKEEKQTVGINDYEFTGDKYISTAKIEDINAALEVLMDELRKFPGLEAGELTPIEDLDSFNANYYTGKKGAYAWEFEGVTGENASSVVYASTEKGFCFYTIDDDGKKELLVFSERESDKKGKITICGDEEIEIEYDNYTKDSVDLSATVSGAVVELKLRSTKEAMSVDFNVNVYGVALSGKLETGKDYYDLNVSASMMGNEIGTMNVNAKMRDFVSYDVPSSGISAEEWQAGLDQEKLMGKLSQLMMQFPFLMDLMQ